MSAEPSKKDDFYRVVATEHGSCSCLNCLMWTIVYDDDGEETEIDQAWQGDAGEELARDLCEWMNLAYERGRQSLPTQAPADLTKYQLEVGLTPDGRDVIVNHPEMDPSPGGRGGHIVFSPQQALDFAALMIKKAEECR